MTQEIKDKLEQAADKRYHPASDHRENYVAGAQTILDNPSDFGLVEKRLVDAGIQLRIETVKACEETHLQNEKYREALEKIAAIAVDYQPSIQTEAALTIAKEALKQH